MHDANAFAICNIACILLPLCEVLLTALLRTYLNIYEMCPHVNICVDLQKHFFNLHLRLLSPNITPQTLSISLYTDRSLLQDVRDVIDTGSG